LTQGGRPRAAPAARSPGRAQAAFPALWGANNGEDPRSRGLAKTGVRSGQLGRRSGRSSYGQKSCAIDKLETPEVVFDSCGRRGFSVSVLFVYSVVSVFWFCSVCLRGLRLA